jgi:hypothetical protein
MTNYWRYRLKGGCYFFTVALAERQSRLLIENIQITNRFPRGQARSPVYD